MADQLADQPPQNDGPAAAAPGSDVPSSRVLRWAVAAALLGALLIYNSAEGPDTALPIPAAPRAGAPASADAPGAPAGSSVRTAPGLPRSAPTRLTIAAIGVDAPFTELRIGPSGKLDPPPEDDNNLVGWYADGPTPGENGSAIVAGHVDTRTGPAVFLLLRTLKPGGTADITRTDGSVATFTVDSVETFPKDAFPDERVYGDTPDAQLRIITCGGSYDRAKRDYLDNVVVFAHLAAVRRS